MKYDPQARAVAFGSEHEVELFHKQLSGLVRAAMVAASAGIEDAKEAAACSKEVFREYSAVVRMLNELRTGLPRRPSGR